MRQISGLRTAFDVEHCTKFTSGEKLSILSKNASQFIGFWLRSVIDGTQTLTPVRFISKSIETRGQNGALDMLTTPENLAQVGRWNKRKRERSGDKVHL